MTTEKAIEAIKEWREARQTFQAEYSPDASAAERNKELFVKLADAEYKLATMKLE